MTILAFTAAAILCFGVIFALAHEKSLEQKYFKLLWITGIPAYMLGLGSIIITGATESVIAITVVAIAMGCYIVLSWIFFMRLRNLTSREFIINVLWGQAAFLVVIFAIPEAARVTRLAVELFT